MNSEEKENEDFNDFLKRREQAAQAYVEGDSEPVGKLAAGTGAATFFSPGGDFTEGAKAVAARYEKDAASFETGSETHFEILHFDSSGDLAYWVGLQKADVRLKGKAEAVKFDLRVTEIFRRENGQWKMIHRHADSLKKEEDKK
jgi:ketosteroid isomerase-like protein